MNFGAFHAVRLVKIHPITPRKERNISCSLKRWLHPLIKLPGVGYNIKSTERADAMVEAKLTGGEKRILENRDILRCIIP